MRFLSPACLFEVCRDASLDDPDISIKYWDLMTSQDCAEVLLDVATFVASELHEFGFPGPRLWHKDWQTKVCSAFVVSNGAEVVDQDLVSAPLPLSWLLACCVDTFTEACVWLLLIKIFQSTYIYI